MDSTEISLERVKGCPVCGSESRRVFCDELRDELFSAPGAWSLHRCLGCRAVYLDPRPAQNSMGAIYRHYYTHSDSPPAIRPPPRAGRIGEIKERLRNGYLEQRFGLSLGPGWKLGGRLVPFFFPRYRIAFDTWARHLPLPRAGARLLDVGCGSGDFLEFARTAGWDVTGLEVDPVAAGIAAERGIRVVQRPLQEAGFADSTFDAVTMNHVIEHISEPPAALREIRRILKPSGLLWIATPNVDSPLRRQLGRSWRGLEVPRHLVLFGRKALRKTIEDSGFLPPSWPRAYPLTRWIWNASHAERDRARGYAKLELRLLELGSMVTQSLSEQLVVLARKPGDLSA